MTTEENTADEKPQNQQGTSKGLNIALWVAQIAVAGIFVMAGGMKLMTPYEAFVESQEWAEATPAMLIKFIGLAELLGAIGVIVPAATRIKPILTPVAAAALVLVMVLAIGLHVMRGEWYALPYNLVPGALAAFVAWGRLTKAKISDRMAG
jgi:putative oxidoreductase